MKPLLLFVCMLLLIPIVPLHAADTPPLPKGYSNWQKSVRKVDNDKKSLFYGIHHIYADAKAMKGYRAGNKFPEGSRIIIEHFNIKDTPAGPVEGTKNMVVLMQKRAKSTSTGGWLYAGYTAQGKPSGLDPVKNCFECHQKDAAGRDYVFSGIADFK